ncbi:MAG: hemolysin D, partial [Proteobacteria bacterium]|nr:hemolysin D [Pseudomonadota bacterium]
VDSMHLAGPVALVRGRLPAAEFTVDGRTFRYHDGMLGTAEVRVRSEPIVFALLPGTRRFQ